jgi:DNA-binding helix-hairpin-helix protein with protein kinase domain
MPLMARVRTSLYADDGAPIELGDRIAKGGEGTVYEVAGQSRNLAKIYHVAPGAEQEAKLLAMARLRTERLLALTAWPVGVIRLGRGGPVRGLLMPRVEGRPIHLLYGPKSRHLNFPEACWAFLIATAANLARAIAAIHEQGHVVADINQGNILVSSRGTVALIDCDSFQVRDGDRLFLCNVGVGPYVPPELQGGSLHVARTPNHDAFGLAVLIFQLLFLGRHPFSGKFLGAGDLPIEKAIRELRFAYGAEAASHQVQPPPATPALAIASPAAATLFERAFSAAGVRDGGRPAAAEWIEPLARLGGELRACALNPAHEYWRGLPSCPWCPLEAASRTAFFDFLRVRPWGGAAALDLQRVWDQIVAVTAPRPAIQPAPRVVHPNPSLRIKLQLLAWLGVMPLFGLFLMLGAREAPAILSSQAAWIGAAVLAACSGWYLRGAGHQVAARAEEARQRLRLHLARWQKETDVRRFADRLRDLERRRREYLELAKLRQERLDELRFHPAVSQLRAFLRRFPIDRARVSGLDDGRRATLRSYGIETAADLDSGALGGVPNLPPQLCIDLLAWKHAVERRFRFVRSAAPADTTQLEREIEQLRLGLETDLLNGAAELRRLRATVEHAQETLRTAIEDAARDLAQAEADLDFYRNMNRPR